MKYTRTFATMLVTLCVMLLVTLGQRLGWCQDSSGTTGTAGTGEYTAQQQACIDSGLDPDCAGGSTEGEEEAGGSSGGMGPSDVAKNVTPNKNYIVTHPGSPSGPARVGK